MSTRRSRFKRIVAITVAILVIPALLSIGCTIRRYHYRQLIEEQWELVRHAGYPTNYEELNDWVAPPEGPNAAPLYKAAFAEIEPYSMEVGECYMAIGEDLSFPSDIQVLAEKIVDQCECGIDKMHQAAEINRCYFHHMFIEGDYLDMPYWSNGAGLAPCLLYLEAAHMAHRGQSEQLTRLIITSLALACGWQSAPHYIARGNSSQHVAHCVNLLKSDVVTNQLSVNQLKRIRNALNDIDPVSHLQNDLARERVQIVWMLNHPETMSEHEDDKSYGLFSRIKILSGEHERDILKYLILMNELIMELGRSDQPVEVYQSVMDRHPEVFQSDGFKRYRYSRDFYSIKELSIDMGHKTMAIQDEALSLVEKCIQNKSSAQMQE